MKEITYKESLILDNPVYIDVRSPDEFSIDHIPGSINKPIFFNEERAEIGKIYKMLGQDDAILKGIEIFSSRVNGYIADIGEYKNNEIIVSCARGGMRSGAVASLLKSLGLNVLKLKNGYKGYRKFITEKLKTLNIKPKLYVLHGLTGVGKSAIIRNMNNIIDLEKIAGHRSSVFGGFGLKQNSQKKFESLLYKKITETEDEIFIIIEGESRKIGDLHIPDLIFKQIQSSQSILIKADIERRIDIIIDEYKEHIQNDEIINAINSIKSKIGKNNTNKLLKLFSNGNIREFTQLLLEKYYDPLYKHTLNKLNYITFINNTDTQKAVKEIQDYIKSI